MKKTSYLLALILGSVSLTAVAQAPAYPARPVRLVVGFAPGGAADYVARAPQQGDAPLAKVAVTHRLGDRVIAARRLISRPAP